MIQGFLQRFNRFRSNLNIKPILKLIWAASPKNTAISIILILIETGLFFASLYLLKLLIDAVVNDATNLSKGSDVSTLIIFAAIAAVLHVSFKSISSFYAEKQSATISEHINEK